MSDIFSRKKRSDVMSRIKSKNTKLELDFRKKLRNNRLKFKAHYRIEGKPDFVIISKKMAIFIDGCF